MSQKRRVNAVLLAALDLFENWGSPDAGDFFQKAVAKYKEGTAVLDNLPEDPTAFVCPHCGEVKPGYGWNYNAGDTGPFAVAYLTVFCGACKGILSVCVTTFMPSEQMAKALMDQFKTRLGKPS